MNMYDIYDNIYFFTLRKKFIKESHEKTCLSHIFDNLGGNF